MSIAQHFSCTPIILLKDDTKSPCLLSFSTFEMGVIIWSWVIYEQPEHSRAK